MIHKMTLSSQQRAEAAKLSRRAALTLPAATLAACTTPKPKVLGTEIPVLPEPEGLTASVDAPAVSLPAPVALAAWPLLLGGSDHAPGNVAGPTGLKQAWRVKIGEAGGYRQPLIASPVAANGRVFTMDANAAVSAFSADSGARQWHTPTRPKHTSVENIGGGIGYDDSSGSGIVYASTGYSELLAIDAASGKIIWRQPLDFPARSAPTIAGGIVALNIQNDLLLTFDPASGTPGWRFTGRVTNSITSVALAGAPAIDSGIVVAGFSSGTLAALDVNSGTPLWEQSMASAYGQASDLDFSDIVGAPVIANGVVYAASLGETMLAIDLRSGAKVWTREASGTEALCAVGGFVFGLDTSELLAAIHADDGLVSWALQLPLYNKPKKKSGPKTWNGPVMVNSQLLLTSTTGDLIMVDPVAGAISGKFKLAGPADLPPIAVGGSLLVLTRDATLTAYS
jgi:outer membrane protein assembly factor BamB